MFKNLDEVKKRWDELFVQHEVDIFDFPSPGYPEEDIVALEQALEFSLHPSLRDLINRFRLDVADFADVCFGDCEPYLEYLRRYSNSSEIEPFRGPDFLMVGRTHEYYLLLDNRTGDIYARSLYDDVQVELIAPYMETLIIRLATIEDTWIQEEWYARYGVNASESRPNLAKRVSKLLVENNLEPGPMFELINGELREKKRDPRRDGFFWEKCALRLL